MDANKMTPEEIKRTFRENANRTLPIFGLGVVGCALPVITEFYCTGSNSQVVVALGLAIWVTSILVSMYRLQCPACGQRFPFRWKFSRDCCRCGAVLIG